MGPCHVVPRCNRPVQSGKSDAGIVRLTYHILRPVSFCTNRRVAQRPRVLRHISSMTCFQTATQRFLAMSLGRSPDCANCASSADLPPVLTAALAIQCQGGSMTVFEKLPCESRNCGIDFLVLPVDDRFGLTLVTHNLGGSALASQRLVTSALRRLRILQNRVLSANSTAFAQKSSYFMRGLVLQNRLLKPALNIGREV